MKKTVALLLACIMVFALFVPAAFASATVNYTLNAGITTYLYWAENYSNTTWTSSNSSVVQIISGGAQSCCIKTKAAGPCTVIAQASYTGYETRWISYPWGGGYYGVVPVTKYDSITYNITVSEPGSDGIDKIALWAGAQAVGQTSVCSVTMQNTAGAYKKDYATLQWSSSNPGIVAVDHNGVLTAKAKGTATVTAETARGVKGACTVQVVDFTGYTAISSADGLNAIRKNPAGKYYLANDIVLNSGTAFTPIQSFSGVLNGNNHAISGLNINVSGNAGLFAATDGALIANLEIRGSTIKGTDTAGAIAGVMDGTLANCRSVGCTVTGKTAGGLAGKCSNAKLCENSSTVTGTAYAGGIIGYYNSYQPTVWLCKNTGTVQSVENGGIAGGIIGETMYGEIIGCANRGHVTGNYLAGGICGFLAGGQIRYSSNAGTITVTSGSDTDADSYRGAGGVAGLITILGRIYDSYNAGDIEVNCPYGDAAAGGVFRSIVENNVDAGSDQLHIHNCYNTGRIKVITRMSGTLRAGAIGGSVTALGNRSYTMLDNCYFLNTGDPGIGYMPYCRAENTGVLSNMQSAASFKYFDFINTWFIDPSADYKYPQPQMLRKINYTVAFNSQGGTAVQAQTAPYNIPIPAPAKPTRAGYTFDGWYKDAACTRAWVFQTDRVNGNITLYAKWNRNVYTVTYNSQGGSAVQSASVYYGTMIAPPANPALSGRRFVGWYKDAACKTPWDFKTGSVTGNLTLYARWTTKNVYTITAKANKPAYGTALNGVTYVEGDTAALIAVPNQGYRFASWTEGGKTVSASYKYSFKVSKARTVTAVFQGIGKPTLSSVKSQKKNSVTLKWSKVGGASGYYIYRSQKSGSGFMKVASCTGTGYTDKGLKKGVKYYYKIQACCRAGGVTTTGGYSGVKSAASK